MYKTDSFARIHCTICGNKEVDVLKPGQPFDSIKKCKCQEAKEETKPNARRRKAAKEV